MFDGMVFCPSFSVFATAFAKALFLVASSTAFTLTIFSSYSEAGLPAVGSRIIITECSDIVTITG